MSAIASPLAITNSPKWIISQREDLIWFVGSALMGYLALALIAATGEAPVWLLLPWAFFLNGPHIFATVTRTYFDGEKRKEMSRLLWMIVPISIVPVILVLIGAAKPLIVVATLWGALHIAKQHVGIVMLYKRKNNERTDIKIDKWFLLISQVLPLALFVLWYLSTPVFGFLFPAALSIQLALGIAYLYRQVVKFRGDAEMNWPKLMLLALVIPLHWLALLLATTDPMKGILIFTVATNIGHSLQYHRLTWFHNRNRYQGGPGLSGLLSHSAIGFYGAALLLSVLYSASYRLLPNGTDVIIFVGPILMHYFLDSKIWRTRDDPKLAKALGIAA